MEVLPPLTDDLGILRTVDHSEPWIGVPDAVAQTARSARTSDDVITKMLDGPRRWPVPLQRELLHPSTGAIAPLVPAGSRTALDLGTGWFGLAPALAALGLRVTRADWAYSRLRFAHLMHPASGGTDVHIALGQLPPAASGPFDVVFLDLDALASYGVDTAAQIRLLTRVRRVLTPGGAVVVAAADHRAALVRDRRVGEALRTPSLTARMEQADLQVQEAVVPLPNRAGWQQLVPRHCLRNHLTAHDQRTGIKRAVGRLLLRAHGERLFAPDGYLVLTPIGTGPVRTLRDHLLAEPGGQHAVLLALSDARVALLGTDKFVKVALSEDQRRALAAEAGKTRHAQLTAFAPVVLAPGDVREAGGVLSVTYPAVVGQQVSPATAGDVIDSALERLDGSRIAPLTDTSVWSRLTSARGQRDLQEIGALPLWQWLVDECSNCAVPIGPSHGDLHPDNVLVPRSGPAVLVDWNRFEERNPLVLDPLYAAVNLARVTAGNSLAEALHSAATDTLPGPLAERARRLRGDLDALPAAVLLLLDRLASYSLPRRRFKPWTLPPFDEAVRMLAEAVHPRSAHGPPVAPTEGFVS